MFGLKLDACTTWMCFNSFASWLSAFITIAISGSALVISIRAYQYAKKKDVEKLKISLGTYLISTTEGAENVFIIHVVNTGHRKVHINGYVWLAKGPFQPGMKLITWIIKNKITSLSSALPTELDDGGDARYISELTIFRDRPEFLFNRSFIAAWFWINSLSLRVDTTRESHQIRAPKDIRKYLWNQYKLMLPTASSSAL